MDPHTVKETSRSRLEYEMNNFASCAPPHLTSFSEQAYLTSLTIWDLILVLSELRSPLRPTQFNDDLKHFIHCLITAYNTLCRLQRRLYLTSYNPNCSTVNCPCQAVHTIDDTISHKAYSKMGTPRCRGHYTHFADNLDLQFKARRASRTIRNLITQFRSLILLKVQEFISDLLNAISLNESKSD